MKILVVGSGGREHALCSAISGSPLASELYCAPGNAGIADTAQLVDIKAEDIDGLVEFAQSKAIDFVVVGPEQPLCLGLVDKMEAAGIATFGPTAAAARLEGSKAFSKDLMQKYGIPTARYGRFTDVESAKAYLSGEEFPIVIKADGLAAGKGVVIAEDFDAADKAIDEMLSGDAFGDAGTEIVIEEFLEGEEVSFFALCDGENLLPLASAQDHKRVGDGDVGPNTGGMGAYSPATVFTDALEQRVIDEIAKPTLAAMIEEGCPYAGVLYVGLMLVERDGEKHPYVIEFNARFGDPECQVILPRMMSDLLPALIAARDGELDQFDLRWHDEAALTVVMASHGYPGSYHKLTEIRNIERALEHEGVQVFHAGTTRDDMGRLMSNGGRVLNLVASGATIKDAQRLAYVAIEDIDWPNGFYRRDIGWRAVGGTVN
ncbi:MAG: phosphoribosylamine--glycine ligase [Alphaproteobacteria bacterium]|nr:phosphoribosylamine--glycine ligase [Alphaproteobacteria bacterium SS10]